MLEFLIFFVSFGAWFYIQSSLWESLFHQYFLDLSPRDRACLFRIRKWAPAIWNIHYDHNVLHHHRTYRSSYVQQFASAREEARLRAVLVKQFDAATVREMTTSRYGATFTRAGHIPFAIPIILNLGWLAVVHGPVQIAAVLCADLIFATPFFIFSKWVHPYMHARFDEAALTAPVPLRWVVTSPYAVAVRISHYVHHCDPTRNYNLQYFADLIRGKWRAPTGAEWSDMVAQGVILPRHRTALEGRRFLLHPF